MSNSILVNEYNRANNRKREKKSFYQVIDVSFLDILKEAEVFVTAKDYKDCLCKATTNLKDYFVECDKCHGQGMLTVNGHKLVCNKCNGEKIVRIHDCYVCNNEGKILLDTKIKIKLNNNLKENDEMVVEYDDYSLILKLHIYDYNDYQIKGNDVYKLKSVIYSKEDYKNKVNKEIITLKGKEYVKSGFKKKKEIIKLEKQGINEGDFYFVFENEVEAEKENIYTNVVLDGAGYVNVDSLINDTVVMSKKCCALNENCIYVDYNTKEIETDDYIINLNILKADEFEFVDDQLVYILNLEKSDLEIDKKAIIVNGDKINVNFKKNLKEVSYFKVNGKVLVDKNGKKVDLTIKINPYFENVFKISIKRNKDVVYVEDYKYLDYRLVDSFKRSDYLDKYIKIKDEDKVYIDEDLVLIKRV